MSPHAHPAGIPHDPPLLIFILDIINLFIHEAGHFLLRPFGRWVSVFGGSFVQVFLPAALLAVTWRQKPGQAWFPAFWLGESLVNASIYIADAPYRKLRLIASGLTHDWYWLLEDHLEAAEPLAWVVFGAGVLLCCGAIRGFRLLCRTGLSGDSSGHGPPGTIAETGIILRICAVFGRFSILGFPRLENCFRRSRDLFELAWISPRQVLHRIITVIVHLNGTVSSTK